jgi:cytoskeletal protein CcmA (bactofilin family)
MTDLIVTGVATIALTSTTDLEFTTGNGYELEVERFTVPAGGFVSLPGIPVSGGSASFSELQVTGISTFSGIATFSANIYVNGDLVVEGNQVFGGISGENINVTGILTTRDLNVSAASTFAGIGTFQNDLYVADDLFVKRDLLVGGAATVGTLTATDARFQNVIVDGNLTGSADGSAIIIDGGSVITGIVTIGPASITLNGLPGQEKIEIGTGSGNAIAGLNTFTNDPSHVRVDEGRFNTFITVSGVSSTSTFKGNVEVEGNITVQGSQVFEGGAEAQDFNVLGITTTQNLRVNNESTFAGVGTFQDNLFVSEDLFVARNANIVGVITAQDLNSTSDRRVKENIEPIEDALNKVTQLNGITFNFINTGTKSAGVIAQEVEAVFPTMVKGEFPKSVNYNGLIGALIESVKELKEQNESLKERIEKLES